MPLPDSLPPAPSSWEALVGPGGGRGRGLGRPPRRRRRTAPLVLGVLLLAAGAWAVQGLVAGADGAPAWHAATQLDPVLAQRYEQARAAAAADGITLEINSGLRSEAEQQALIDKEIARRGSPEEAHRWVAPVRVSAHVQGRALDVGPAEGAAWLREHGPQFGLCPVFDNEPWHVEALTEPGGVCPPTLPDGSSLWD